MRALSVTLLSTDEYREEVVERLRSLEVYPLSLPRLAYSCTWCPRVGVGGETAAEAITSLWKFVILRAGAVTLRMRVPVM